MWCQEKTHIFDNYGNQSICLKILVNGERLIFVRTFQRGLKLQLISKILVAVFKAKAQCKNGLSTAPIGD